MNLARLPESHAYIFRIPRLYLRSAADEFGVDYNSDGARCKIFSLVSEAVSSAAHRYFRQDASVFYLPVESHYHMKTAG
jgi:hypothetical protein